MDLERAMALLATLIDHGEPEPQLTERVRAAMIEALATGGRGLPEPLRSEIASWFNPSPDLIYQEMLSRGVRRTESGSYTVVREGRLHRATGAYYTGEAVVRYMVERAGAYAPHAASLIDPACGAGAFLASASAGLGALTRLVGLDTDPVALSLCRAKVPGVVTRQADALLEGVEERFDLCLGNPPYISSGLRGAAAQAAERQEALKRRYPHTGQYKLNTYPLFVERGLELLRPGGVLGYIIPDSFLTGRYFAGLRRLLLSHTLLEMTLIRREFWQHGRVGQSVILFVRKEAPRPGHLVGIRICEDVAELAQAPLTAVPVTEISWSQLARFRLVPDPGRRALLRQMEIGPRPAPAPLGNFLHTYSGLIGRAGQKSLLRSENPTAAGPWGRLLRSGREIDRFRLTWAGEEVLLDPSRIKSGGSLSYYRSPKILLRQTADSLRGVYDEQGYFCLNNIHLFIPSSTELPTRALLGVINSTAADRWYRSVTMESGRLYPQVDLDLASLLPVPPAEQSDWERLADLVARREKATPSEVAYLERQIDQLVDALYGLEER